MNSNFFQEIIKIRKELKNITRELDNIANDIRTEFKGVGNNRCSQCVKDSSDEYKKLIRYFDNIDFSDFN